MGKNERALWVQFPLVLIGSLSILLSFELNYPMLYPFALMLVFFVWLPITMIIREIMER